MDLHDSNGLTDVPELLDYYKKQDWELMITLAKPDTGDEGMNVQVGCASDLDVITNLASLSKGIGFTPVIRKTCWLLWGFLDDTT